MDLTRPVLWAVGVVAAIVIGIVGWLRTRSVNTHDPLQDRLAEHFRRYLETGRSGDEQAALVEALRSELKQRQVPRDEWRFRLSSALNLIGPTDTRTPAEATSKAHDLVDVIERLGTSS